MTQALYEDETNDTQIWYLTANDWSQQTSFTLFQKFIQETITPWPAASVSIRRIYCGIGMVDIRINEDAALIVEINTDDGSKTSLSDDGAITLDTPHSLMVAVDFAASPMIHVYLDGSELTTTDFAGSPTETEFFDLLGQEVELLDRIGGGSGGGGAVAQQLTTRQVAVWFGQVGSETDAQDASLDPEITSLGQPDHYFELDGSYADTGSSPYSTLYNSEALNVEWVTWPGDPPATEEIALVGDYPTLVGNNVLEQYNVAPQWRTSGSWETGSDDSDYVYSNPERMIDRSGHALSCPDADAVALVAGGQSGEFEIGENADYGSAADFDTVTKWTIAFSVKVDFDEFASVKQLFGTEGAPNEYHVQINMDVGALGVDLSDGLGGTWSWFTDTSIGANTWHSYVVSYDGTKSTNSERLRCYVDGAEMPPFGGFPADCPTEMADWSGGPSFIIGDTSGGPFGGYDGADFALWDLAVWIGSAAGPEDVAGINADRTSFGAPTHRFEFDGDAADTGDAPYGAPTVTGAVSYGGPPPAPALIYVLFDCDTGGEPEADTVLVWGHNFGDLDGCTVYFEQATTSTFAGATTLFTWSPTTNARLVGVGSLRFIGPRYLRLKIFANGGFNDVLPRVGEVIFGRSRQMPHQPSTPYDSMELHCEASEFVADDGDRARYGLVEGRREVALRYSPAASNSHGIDHVLELRRWWHECEHGTRPSILIHAPETDPEDALVVYPELPALSMPRVGPFERSFEIRMVEAAPFAETEE